MKNMLTHVDNSVDKVVDKVIDCCSHTHYRSCAVLTSTALDFFVLLDDDDDLLVTMLTLF